MEALPTGLAIIDHETGAVRSNAAFKQIWGAGQQATKAVGDRFAYVACTEQCGNTTCAISGTVVEIDRPGGGHRYILNSAAPILDANGHVASCVVGIQDITGRVNAERALAESEGALARLNDELAGANDELAAANAELIHNSETLEARVEARTSDLARRTTQLQSLARDLTRAEDRERNRVAQVIHDHLQQLLSAARINVGIALKQPDVESIQKTLGDVDQIIGDSLAITRSLTAELSPAILRRRGLAAALRWLGQWYDERFALHVHVDAEDVTELEEEMRTALFRSVGELLFNVVKHSKVTSARVLLGRLDDGRVRISVSDQGAGFDPEAVRAREGAVGNFGLFSLRERLECLGAQLDIDSAPGCGSRVTITVGEHRQNGAEARE